MNLALRQQLGEQVPNRLAELLAVPPRGVKVKREPAARFGMRAEVDMLVSAGKLLFVVECKASGQAASVAMAIRSVSKFAEQLGKKAIRLVAVPYMGEVGRRLTEEAGVCWLDLSGNAHLIAPGLRVDIEGKPNQFKRRGRPRSVFAPKSARIARWLLIHRERAFTQRELAKATGLDEGFISRIVHQLVAQRLVAREPSGAVRVADYDAMLDAWHEIYDFSKHHIVRGHIAARSGDEVVQSLAMQLKREQAEYAVTGLAGAWLLNQFAGFRLAVIYAGQMPSPEALQRIGFHEVAQGENVWLVVPNDEGVFHGAAEHEGIACVHPVQAYLDLKNHPERSPEAAEELRQKLLSKGSHA